MNCLLVSIGLVPQDIPLLHASHVPLTGKCQSRETVMSDSCTIVWNSLHVYSGNHSNTIAPIPSSPVHYYFVQVWVIYKYSVYLQHYLQYFQ